jgi:hypothetical protein
MWASSFAEAMPKQVHVHKSPHRGTGMLKSGETGFSISLLRAFMSSREPPTLTV